MVSRLSILSVAGLCALYSFSPAQAEGHISTAGIQVKVNKAKVVKLSRPATTVIIGNPEIADATVQDSQTLVLTGRGFGSTNLVILDATGTPIMDEEVAVSRDTSGVLRVYRRADVENLSCTPECEGSYLSEAELQSITALRIANEGEDENNN